MIFLGMKNLPANKLAITLKNAWSRDTELKTTEPNPMEHGFEDVDPRGLFSGKNPLFLRKE